MGLAAAVVDVRAKGQIPDALPGVSKQRPKDLEWA